MFRPLNVTVFREVHFKGWIHENVTEVSETKHTDNVLNFKNNTWFKIHINL